MYDGYGDGWNGNSWNLFDGDTLVASCTLDTGSEGYCDFSLSGVASQDEVSPVEAVDNAPEGKVEESSADTDDHDDEGDDDDDDDDFIFISNTLLGPAQFVIQNGQTISH